MQGCNSVEDCIVKMGPRGDAKSKLYCNECKEDTMHHVWSTIVEEPELLLIQLKRFNNNGKKLRRKMKVTQEIDVSAVCSIQPGDNLSYSLMGAILHEGQTSISGHYTSLLKLHGCWHLFDDERISKVNDTNAAAELEVCCDNSCNIYVTLVFDSLEML
ncbi:ubiquitin carboxyl-terminal hydrolase 17-like protein B [Orbicella faveolata]|uniref:ubiquitin carboxyl-terminal hydrolase 17-like protein B n=1 Tax=Orbicella faveolata TaxID=48498 RepID=UPI0009E60555|nr:ubiquitin carboxyl-terminal hydrolase 17-like protein B [Orbicella faveolata]